MSDDDVFQYSPDELTGADPRELSYDGAELLDEVEAAFRKYTVQTSAHVYVALSAYVAYTHAASVFDFAPRLVLTSAEKRSGKSRSMEVARCMSHNPLVSANATVPAIFRSLGEEDTRTLCFDEADTIFGTKIKAEQNEDLRGLLNAGFQKGMPVLRTVPPKHDVQEFATFAPAIIAAIGDLPDTITDRAINVRLRRRKSSETVSSFRMKKDQPILTDIGARLQLWIAGNLDELEDMEPETPLEDRAADVWEPLFAVADLAGGSWPTRVRAASVALTKEAAEADEERSEGIELLADIRDVLTLVTGDFVLSENLLNLLRSKEESRWADGELSARKLSSLLKTYQIRPKRDTSGKKRGYVVATFNDAFDRYLATKRQEPSEPSETTPDQEERSDTSKPSDTSMCQTNQSVRSVSPGQSQDLTHLTGSDAMWPEECNDDKQPTPKWGVRPNGQEQAS